MSVDPLHCYLQRAHAIAEAALAPDVRGAELLHHLDVGKESGYPDSQNYVQVQHQEIVTINHQLLRPNDSNSIPKPINTSFNCLAEVDHCLYHFKRAPDLLKVEEV